MNLLAISYVLPPNLYPQAIQIGRLLYNLTARVGTVSGTSMDMAGGLDCYSDFDKRLAFRLEVKFNPLFSGLLHRLACYSIPFYGRTPDEFRGWVTVADKVLVAYLPEIGFVPDVLISFGAPMSDHLLGLRLKRRLQLPWVAHFSDPWSDNSFNRRFFLANYVNRYYEAEVIRDADRVIFTSSETLDLVMRKYPAAWRSKARVLPHSYEPGLYSQPVKTRNGPLVFRYLGGFYGSRSPLPLFQALADIYRESPALLENLRIELIGNVPKRMLCNSAFHSLPKGIVKTLSTVSYSQSLNLMTEADLLLVIDAPDEISVFLPSKLVDYIGAGVPIIGIVPPGASASLIGRLGGQTANPSNRKEIVSVLKAAIEDSWSRRADEDISPWGAEEVRAEYCADRVAGRLLEIIKEVAA